MTSEDIILFKNQVKEIFLNKSIEEAISTLKPFIKSHTVNHQILSLIEKRVNDFNKDKLLGLLSQEQAEITKNKINNDFYQLISLLTSKDLSLSHSEEASKQENALNKSINLNKKSIWVLLSCIAIVFVFMVLYYNTREDEYNEVINDPPKITYMEGFKNVIVSECPIVNKDKRYIDIYIKINKDYWESSGMLYVKLYKRTALETMKKSLKGKMDDKELEKLVGDQDGFVNTNFLSKYYKTKQGTQHLRIENELSSGKYVIEYGYYYSINKNRAKYTNKYCNYEF